MTKRKSAPKFNELGYPILEGKAPAAQAEVALTRKAAASELRDLLTFSSTLTWKARRRANVLIDMLGGGGDA